MSQAILQRIASLSSFICSFHSCPKFRYEGFRWAT